MSTLEANSSGATNTQYGVKTSVHPITRLNNATRYSLKGLKATYQHEQAFRFEVGVLAVALPLALWIAQSPLEFFLLIGSILAVMVVELLNTGIEMVVDRIGVEHHELSGRAKDCGSAAVMLSILMSVACWLVMVFTG